MLITVKRSDNQTVCIAIELHGTLKSFSEEIRECKIGDLFCTNQDNVILLIGSYILEGKAVTLEKPLAILKKTEKHLLNLQISNNDDPMYVVETIILKKYVFRSRPKPLIMNVAQSV